MIKISLIEAFDDDERTDLLEHILEQDNHSILW
jgi:hypothetical protein